MTSPEGVRRRRVPALAADQRRAALIAATVPLIREHGLDVTTRQIARAAGVAEGTIFGVFPDKNSLVQAALTDVLDPARAVNALTGIDPATDLRTRLQDAAERLRRSFRENAAVFAAIRTLAFTTNDSEFQAQLKAGRDRTVASLTALIEPDRLLLRREPSEVAGLLLLLIGATNHGAFGGTDRFTAADLVSILLDGLLQPSDDNDHGSALRC